MKARPRRMKAKEWTLWAWRDADGRIVPYTLHETRYACGLYHDPMRHNGLRWEGRIARVRVTEILPRPKPGRKAGRAG